MKSRDASKKQKRIWQPSVKPEKKVYPFLDWKRDAAPMTAPPTPNAAASRKKLTATALLIASEIAATEIGQWNASDARRTATGNETAVGGSHDETIGVIGTGTEIGTGTGNEMLDQKGDGADPGAAAGTVTEAGTAGATVTGEIEIVTRKRRHAVVAGTGAQSRLDGILPPGGQEVATRCVTADAAGARVRSRALFRALPSVVVAATSFDPRVADPQKNSNSLLNMASSFGVFQSS